jgi:hypothetical protein
MSYAGDVVRFLLLPVTAPFKWLFKHRCKFKNGETTCTGLFCPVGKEGQPGWDNNYRGGEWVYRKPLPTTKPRAPASPPKRGGFGRYYSDSQIIVIDTDKNNKITIRAPGNVTINYDSENKTISVIDSKTGGPWSIPEHQQQT